MHFNGLRKTACYWIACHFLSSNYFIYVELLFRRTQKRQLIRFYQQLLSAYFSAPIIALNAFIFCGKYYYIIHTKIRYNTLSAGIYLSWLGFHLPLFRRSLFVYIAAFLFAYTTVYWCHVQARVAKKCSNENCIAINQTDVAPILRQYRLKVLQNCGLRYGSKKFSRKKNTKAARWKLNGVT